jgi:hypothetical protein
MALDAAVDLYAAAIALPSDARESLLQPAGRRRDIAVTTWSSAATQLDVLNIDAGNGLARVFLSAVPGQGALTADGTPEGKLRRHGRLTRLDQPLADNELRPHQPGSISTPTALRPPWTASTSVVPVPAIGSRTMSPGRVYSAIRAAAKSGAIRAG